MHFTQVILQLPCCFLFQNFNQLYLSFFLSQIHLLFKAEIHPLLRVFLFFSLVPVNV